MHPPPPPHPPTWIQKGFFSSAVHWLVPAVTMATKEAELVIDPSALPQLTFFFFFFLFRCRITILIYHFSCIDFLLLLLLLRFDWIEILCTTDDRSLHSTL